jgi:uncharacterized Zn-binding protein involved in type VI secretion
MGDNTAHGTPLSPGPGSTNVLIGKMPAWRVGRDSHACPMVTPAGTPHSTEVCPMGSTSVLINKMPAARMGDTLTGAGSPNSIVKGCTTVLIG